MVHRCAWGTSLLGEGDKSQPHPIQAFTGCPPICTRLVTTVPTPWLLADKVCVCMHVLCVHCVVVCMCICVVCVYTYICVCMCTCVACVYVCCVCMHMGGCIHTCVVLHACVSTLCTCVCVCTHACYSPVTGKCHQLPYCPSVSCWSLSCDQPLWGGL